MDMTRTATAVRSRASSAPTDHASVPDPLSKLRAMLDDLGMKDNKGPAAFATFERELHARLMEIERDVVSAEMAKHDVDADAVVIAGKVHRRVLRQSQTYLTGAGEVVVERTLYKDRTDAEGRCVSPMELTVGVVGDFWTPRAAQQALWVVTQMTPGKAAELFDRVGSMAPSKTSLDRLPKRIAARWEGDRERLEAALREGLVIPEGAVSIAVSLDGVLAPMEGADPIAHRAAAEAAGHVAKGPAGYREVGCATVGFCDAEGELLGAVRLARAPEANKATLKEMLAAEVRAILRRRPELRMVKLADAVADNWTFLTADLPAGDEAIDFFHATEHLHAAIAAAYGDGTRETTFRYETLRDALRDEVSGVEKVIRALTYLAGKHPRREVIRRARNYFRTHRARMRYAQLRAQGLMIGSGVVEAACKTLVTQRLKNSGMRWSTAGAQAILTPRGWDQSERFDKAWALIVATYHAEVTALAKVVALKPKSEARHSRASR
jgi:hypothetical protein